MHFLPKRTQPVTITKLDLLMLFKETIAVYAENSIKPINTRHGFTES
jgi:hypothetical protein